MKAWHFLQDNGRLQWRCGRAWKPKVGQTLKVDADKLRMCSYGLHASKKIIDALRYAPGSLICRVELGGTIIKDDDKVCASERTIIAMADATNVLHEIACWSAEQALKKIKKPDPRSFAAIQAKRKWLRGEITDAELSAARSAARSAAWSAWSAWSAGSAAESAAWSAQNRQLTKMVNELLGIKK
jgi:hypothetical protein